VALDVKNKIIRPSLDSDGMKFKTELKSYKRVRDQIKQKKIMSSTLLCEEHHCIEEAYVVSRYEHMLIIKAQTISPQKQKAHEPKPSRTQKPSSINQT